jgi:hypothetical protein
MFRFHICKNDIIEPEETPLLIHLIAQRGGSFFS